MTDNLLVFLACLVPAILILARHAFRNKNLPPGPLPLPIIGHLHLFRGCLPHRLLHRLSKRYGPLMQLRLGSIPCVIVSTPDLAKEFLKTKERSFARRPSSIAIDCISFGGQGFTFSPYGSYSKYLKKVTMVEFLGSRPLSLSHSVRKDELTVFLQKINRKADAGEAVDVGLEASGLLNNLTSRMAMGRRFCGSESELGDMHKSVEDIGELIGMSNLSDLIWFLKKVDLQGHKKRIRDVMAEYDSIIEKIIVEHEDARKLKKKETENDVKDLLDVLLDMSQDQTSKVELTRDGIKVIILDILAGATGTSSVSIQWVISELINNPRVMQKVAQEIESVVGNERLVEESDIPNLPYLQAVVKESFRLHPTGPIIPRECSEDCEVAGYHIPAKTRIMINVWAIGRDPNVWENPLEFRPERFMDSDEKVDVRGHHFQLLMFGSGRRICPGISLGLPVVQTTIAGMIQCFEWKSEENSGKVDMEEGYAILLHRATPLVCFPVAKPKSIQILS